MANIVSGVVLTVIAILTYFIIFKLSQVEFFSKRKRLSSVIKDNEDDRNPFFDWLEKKGISRYVNPIHMMETAKLYGTHITKSSYFSTFLFGTAIGLIIMMIYFRVIFYLFPLSIIGGFIATNVRIHNIKKNFLQEIDSKLSIYMSSTSTAMGTFGNIKDALGSVIPLLEYPIKNDVEDALLKLQDGKSIKYAFESMNRKYPQKQVRLFHEQLDIISKVGTFDVENLRSVAGKMKQKESRRRKLKTAHRQSTKRWRTFVFLSLSGPFLFLLGSTDSYFLVMNHIASSVVFFFTFLLIFITYRKLEELELYDPTTDKKVDLS